jgi:hypothetical protein
MRHIKPINFKTQAHFALSVLSIGQTVLVIEAEGFRADGTKRSFLGLPDIADQVAYGRRLDHHALLGLVWDAIKGPISLDNNDKRSQLEMVLRAYELKGNKQTPSPQVQPSTVVITRLKAFVESLCDKHDREPILWECSACGSPFPAKAIMDLAEATSMGEMPWRVADLRNLDTLMDTYFMTVQAPMTTADVLDQVRDILSERKPLG